MKKEYLPYQITSLAAFLLPALALWVRSGPSYSSALMLIGALCFLPLWIKKHPTSATWALAALLLCMAILWMELTTQQGINRADRPIKWVIGAFCLLFATAFPPRPKAFFLGLPIGCIGMGGLALWQVLGQGMERATGYTSAIPWGDTALLLACFTGTYAAIFWRDQGWHWRMLQIVAVISGAGASLLSHSRGGWLALGLAFPMFLLVARQLQARFFRPIFMLLGGLTLALLLVIASVPHLRAHVEKAGNEISQYFESHSVNTSLGIRLEQYRLTFAMIPEKPLRGWSREGFYRETERRVAAGEYDPAILEYRDYVHNELLDNWVKTGVLGMLLQLSLYGIPLFLFWPSAQRMARPINHLQWQTTLALRLMGCLMGVMYLGFGMTMPFFAHNSGTVFFIFCIIYLWSALQGIERELKDKEFSCLG